MRSPSLLRRLAAAATGLWLVASSSLSPLLACDAHGGMRGHRHDAAATVAAVESDAASAEHRHGGPATTHAPAAHDRDDASGHVAHHAAAHPTDDTPGAPAHDARHDDGDAPCTCAGSCCPSALVATPGLQVAPALATLVAVVGRPALAADTAVPAVAPQHRQPPSTPPPVRTLS